MSDFLTYICKAHGSVSWFDHVVCSGTARRSRHVLSCETFDDISFGDHSLPKIVYYFKKGDKYTATQVNWSSASDAQI